MKTRTAAYIALFILVFRDASKGFTDMSKFDFMAHSFAYNLGYVIGVLLPVLAALVILKALVEKVKQLPSTPK